MDKEFHEFRWQTDDGLTLFAKDWPCQDNKNTTLLCLAGLTRNSDDFDSLACFLSKKSKFPRRVLAFDYRGRGRSDYDHEYANYQFERELKDIVAGLDSCGLDVVDVIGTSRGGIHAMLMATFLPNRINKVILNDIGPEIPSESLDRIKNYVGVAVNFNSIQQAANHLKDLFGRQFPNQTDNDWISEANRTFKQVGGKFELNYDPNLSKVFDDQKNQAKSADLWQMFENLKQNELLVLHGGLSDILEAKTVKKMEEIHPNVKTHTVSDQGHPVQLEKLEIFTVIDSFLN